MFELDDGAKVDAAGGDGCFPPAPPSPAAHGITMSKADCMQLMTLMQFATWSWPRFLAGQVPFKQLATFCPPVDSYRLEGGERAYVPPWALPDGRCAAADSIAAPLSTASLAAAWGAAEDRLMEASKLPFAPSVSPPAAWRVVAVEMLSYASPRCCSHVQASLRRLANPVDPQLVAHALTDPQGAEVAELSGAAFVAHLRSKDTSFRQVTEWILLATRRHGGGAAWLAEVAPLLREVDDGLSVAAGVALLHGLTGAADFAVEPAVTSAALSAATLVVSTASEQDLLRAVPVVLQLGSAALLRGATEGTPRARKHGAWVLGALRAGQVDLAKALIADGWGRVPDGGALVAAAVESGRVDAFLAAEGEWGEGPALQSLEACGQGCDPALRQQALCRILADRPDLPSAFFTFAVRGAAAVEADPSDPSHCVVRLLQWAAFDGDVATLASFRAFFDWKAEDLHTSALACRLLYSAAAGRALPTLEWLEATLGAAAVRRAATQACTSAARSSGTRLGPVACAVAGRGQPARDWYTGSPVESVVGELGAQRARLARSPLEVREVVRGAVQWLLDHGAAVDEAAVVHAAASGDAELVHMLARAGDGGVRATLRDAVDRSLESRECTMAAGPPRELPPVPHLPRALYSQRLMRAVLRQEYDRRAFTLAGVRAATTVRARVAVAEACGGLAAAVRAWGEESVLVEVMWASHAACGSGSGGPRAVYEGQARWLHGLAGAWARQRGCVEGLTSAAAVKQAVEGAAAAVHRAASRLEVSVPIHMKRELVGEVVAAIMGSEAALIAALRGSG